MVKVKDASVEYVKNVLAWHEEKRNRKHSLAVLDICEKIAEKLSTYGVNTDKNLLYKGALLHDIGKSVCEKDKHQHLQTRVLCGNLLSMKGKQHHRYAAIVIENRFDCEGEDNREFARKLFAVVEAHKGEFNPGADVAVEAAILRMADKIAHCGKKKSKKRKRAKEKYKENLKEIRGYFNGCGLFLFKDFEIACKKAKNSM